MQCSDLQIWKELIREELQKRQILWSVLASQIKFKTAFEDICKKHAFLNRYVLLHWIS
jgi:hypothetical protein